MGWIENKLARTREYNKENYEQIVMRVPKGTKEKIKAAAEAVGKSMTSYIMEVVEEKNREGLAWKSKISFLPMRKPHPFGRLR